MITEERAKLVSAARASRNALQDFVENPSRLHPQSPALAGFHLGFLERRFADKSIIGSTLRDIDHVIKNLESKWRDDIMQLQAVTTSWCPVWEPKADNLLAWPTLARGRPYSPMSNTRSCPMLLGCCP